MWTRNTASRGLDVDLNPYFPLSPLSTPPPQSISYYLSWGRRGWREEDGGCRYTVLFPCRENNPHLTKDVGPVTVDKTVTGNNRVTGDLLLLHAEICTGVFHEHVVFDKGAGIQQDVDPLPCRQLPLLVLRFDSLHPALSFKSN